MAATLAQGRAIARKWAQEVYVSQNQTAEADADDLVAAAMAAYDWAEGSQTDYNGDLPEPFKSLATGVQKARLLQYAVEELVEAG